VRHCGARRREEPLESYIVRVYRQEKKNPRMLVGTVEKVGKRGRAAFTNMDELWEIVDEGTEGRVKMRKMKDGPEKEMRARGQKPGRSKAEKR
jgi:hypothetical protein